MRPCRFGKHKYSRPEHKGNPGLRQRETAAIRRSVIKRWKEARGCSECNNKNLYGHQLDLDHIDKSKKSFSLAQNPTLNKPWDIVKEEIGKCQILCKNCHAHKTYISKDYL